MILASYNVENLFSRPRAMNLNQGQAGPILAAQAELQQLLQLDSYAGTQSRILELLEVLGLLRSDASAYAVLRKVRGQLLKRPQAGPVEVVAAGRADWIGWVELTRAEVNEQAMRHTAMVIRDVGADVLGVIEAEDRDSLNLFSASLLSQVDGQPYEQVMVIEGNDTRGIDVGLLTRAEYPLKTMRTHIFDTDTQGVIFSRDCAEYHLGTPTGAELIVLINHFKSKGYGSKGDPLGKKKRHRQASRVAEIYRGLISAGHPHIAVLGDLNDSPGGSVDALVAETDLRDISEHPDFEWGPRRGTYGSGNEKDKIDYVLLSPGLFARARGGQVFRKGVYRGPRTKNPWEIYPTLTRQAEEASDHAAILADLDL